MAAYGLPALPLAIVGLPLNVYLPSLYTAGVGLSLSTVGLVLLLVRLSDVITDPLVGTLSDRTRGRLGRRRPWLLLALPIGGPALWFLFVPPQGAGALHLLVASALLYLAWTMIAVPYQAWGAELTGDYFARTRIAAWREGFSVIGVMASAALPALLADPAPQSALRALAAVTLAFAPPALLLMLLVVPEPPAPARARASGGWRTIAANRPFRLLLAAWTVNGIANGLPAALFLAVVGDVLRIPDRAGPLLFAYFAAAVAAVPLWAVVARRIGKHRAWGTAMLWACLVFAFVPLLGAGDFSKFLAICLLSGAALGADLALPPAMQADVVDLDELRSGQARAGLFFAAWSMAQKLGNAAAVGIGLPLLEVFGYAPGTGQGLAALVVLYAVVPVVLKLAAVAMVWRFPIDAAEQRRIRLAVEARRAA
jgi:GPH family glycoside/pentoside/hexuronide:cation symporter